ncbi:hypothetical protein SBA3_130003 [Candidatus Sulfopaludibacter sp. SbA3]|nr:hypothetical protein SBA3_130003 [Candidatus Sulfopaludibacter sp. SbA3]
MAGKRVGISRRGKFEPGTKIRQKAANFEPGGEFRAWHGFAADTRLGDSDLPTTRCTPFDSLDSPQRLEAIPAVKQVVLESGFEFRPVAADIPDVGAVGVIDAALAATSLIQTAGSGESAPKTITMTAAVCEPSGRG